MASGQYAFPRGSMGTSGPRLLLYLLPFSRKHVAKFKLTLSEIKLDTFIRRVQLFHMPLFVRAVDLRNVIFRINAPNSENSLLKPQRLPVLFSPHRTHPLPDTRLGCFGNWRRNVHSLRSTWL